MSNEKALSAIEAGEFLHTLLPIRTPNQWTNWLGNNRADRDGVVSIPYGRMGKIVTYSDNDLMEAAVILAKDPGIRRMRSKPEKAVEVVGPVVSMRPGLEMALKIIADLPEGVSAENAIKIALSVIPQ